VRRHILLLTRCRTLFPGYRHVQANHDPAVLIWAVRIPFCRICQGEVGDGDEVVVVGVCAGDFDGVDILREEYGECDDEDEADSPQKWKHDDGSSA